MELVNPVVAAGRKPQQNGGKIICGGISQRFRRFLFANRAVFHRWES